MRRPLRSLPRWLLPVGAAGLLLVVAGGVAFAGTQRALRTGLPMRAGLAVKGPLRVPLGQAVAAGLVTRLEPAVAGTWHQERGLLGVTAVTFEPRGRFQAGQRYQVRLTGLRRVGTGAAIPDLVQTFVTPAPAGVRSVSPAANATSVGVKPRLTVTLSTPNHEGRDLQASLDPAVPLRLVSSDDTTFTWEPATALRQGAGYTFVVEDALMPAARRRLVTAPFTTVSAPVVVSARTGGYLSPGQTIDIIFDQAMAPGGAGFAFDLKGQGSWVDPHTYRFTPQQLTPGTTYGYRVKAGIQSAAGGVMEAERAFQVATTGAVTAGVSPGGSGVSVGSAIRVSFDQAVDHGSAQSRFSLNPAVNGSFSWSGNTMTFRPAQLAYQTGYSYGVAAGVVPGWGLPSNHAIGGSFSTEQQIVKLGVPVYHQAYGRSCELASLRMLLAYRGIGTTDYTILQRIGYAPRPRDTATNSWEDPNQQFVGIINTFSWSQGYGVHAGPVAAAAKTFGRNASAFFGVSAAWIATNLYQGNPVEFYGHIGEPTADSWNTASGVVQTTTSMHARVIYGVAGPANNPSGFYIADPWTATTFYWSAAQVMANMNAVPGVSNQAVVVY